MRFKIIIILIPFFFIMFSGCAYYNTFYNAKKFYKEAEKDRKKREKMLLVELSPEEKARRKKSGQATTNTGNIASSKEMQNYQRAIEKASRVLEFYPQSKYIDDALILLGKCFYYRRDYNKALRKFEEIIKLYPDSEFIPYARLLMAKTYVGLENFDEAENQFRNITLDNNIDNKIIEEAKFELGGLYYEKGDYELAAENYKSTAKEADDKLIRAMSLYRLGECLIQLKQYHDAPKILNQAVKASPNEDFKSQATYKLGEAQSMIGDYDTAVKTYSNLLSKEFEKTRIPKTKLALAENLSKKGDLQEALKWYDNIIEEHKRTDASARSYFAKAEIEEFVNINYKKAKENYDQVRAEFSSSLIAPEAKDRSDNIRILLELREEIAKLEGRYVETDSLNGDEKNNNNQNLKDDAPINLSMDGMWVYYSGRDRPPPKSLTDLTQADLERAAKLAEIQQQTTDSADSTAMTTTTDTKMDSAAIALAKEKEEQQKVYQLAEKKLALAEVLFFNFNKPDSAILVYNQVIENQTDSALTTRALYSLGYIYKEVKNDSTSADSIFRKLLSFNPQSEQADGARYFLKLPIVQNNVDSAQIYFKKAEDAYWLNNDIDDAFNLYNNVIENYPNSEYAVKAIYAQGWMSEKILYNPDKAMTYYEKIVSDYPDTPFGKTVKAKLAAVERFVKEEEARQKAIADSLARLAEAKNDSLTTSANDSLQQNSIDDTKLQTANDSTQVDSTDQHKPPVSQEDPKSQVDKKLDSNIPSAESVQTDTTKKDTTKSQKPPVSKKPPENQADKKLDSDIPNAKSVQTDTTKKDTLKSPNTKPDNKTTTEDSLEGNK